MWVGGESRNGEMMGGREDTPRQGWVWEVGVRIQEMEVQVVASAGGVHQGASAGCRPSVHHTTGRAQAQGHVLPLGETDSRGKCELQPLCVGPDPLGRGSRGRKKKMKARWRGKKKRQAWQS